MLGGGDCHLVPNEYVPTVRAANHKLAPRTVKDHLHNQPSHETETRSSAASYEMLGQAFMAIESQ